MAIWLILHPNFRILQNKREQLILKWSFSPGLEAHYPGEKKETFSRLVKNFVGVARMNVAAPASLQNPWLPIQPLAVPKNGWRVFSKGLKKLTFVIEKDKLTEQIKQALWDLKFFLFIWIMMPMSFPKLPI